MYLIQIKAAVDAGLTVHWRNERYTVIRARDSYLIVHDRGAPGESCIGLTWTDGKTMNGSPDDFYVPAEQLDYVVDEDGDEISLDEYRISIRHMKHPGTDQYRYVRFSAGFEPLWVAVLGLFELPEPGTACELAIDLLLAKNWFADETQTAPELVI